MEKYPTEENSSAPISNMNTKVLTVKGALVEGVPQFSEDDVDSYVHLTLTDLNHGQIERYKCDDFPESKDPSSIEILLKTKDDEIIALRDGDNTENILKAHIVVPHNKPQHNVNTLATLTAESQLFHRLGINRDVEVVCSETYIYESGKGIVISTTCKTDLSKEEISSDFMVIPNERHKERESNSQKGLKYLRQRIFKLVGITTPR